MSVLVINFYWFEYSEIQLKIERNPKERDLDDLFKRVRDTSYLWKPKMGPHAGFIKIDEKSMKQIMGYLRIDDHDIFVGYIRKIGIEHED